MFEQTTVKELRDMLVKSGMTEQEVEDVKGKSNLVALVIQRIGPEVSEVDSNEKYSSTTIEVDAEVAEEAVQSVTVEKPAVICDEMTDEAVEDNPPSKEDKVHREIVPKYLSEAWEDYILGLLRPTEKDKSGNPTTAGLRRLANRVLGPIVFSGPTQVFPSTDGALVGRATVVWRIDIQWKADVEEWINIADFKMPVRTFVDVADCWTGNTDGIYSVHTAGTAATRAEGRALRKALGVTRIVAEENTTEVDVEAVIAQSRAASKGETLEWNTDDMISGTQRVFIERMCEKMGIDVYKFINKSHFSSGGEKPIKYSDITKVEREIASKMTDELNRYQSNSNDSTESRPIPVEILK